MAATQNLYFVGGIDGMGDRLSDSEDYMQLNSYLYYVGIKGYPFHTGLVLCGRAGLARLVYQSSLSYTETSETGYGFGGTIAYDFDRDSTGFSFETGLTLNALQDMGVEDVSVSTNQVFLYGKLIWK